MKCWSIHKGAHPAYKCLACKDSPPHRIGSYQHYLLSSTNSLQQKESASLRKRNRNSFFNFVPSFYLSNHNGNSFCSHISLSSSLALKVFLPSILLKTFWVLFDTSCTGYQCKNVFRELVNGRMYSIPGFS